MHKIYRKFNEFNGIKCVCPYNNIYGERWDLNLVDWSLKYLIFIIFIYAVTIERPCSHFQHTPSIQNPESSAELCPALSELYVDIKYSEIDNDIFHE